MTALTKDCTAAERTDLALEIAQHPHLQLCDFCALALAEITADVAMPWSRQTLNALAHRCQEDERLSALVAIVHDTDPPRVVAATTAEGGDE